MALERRAHTRPSPAVGEAREGREPGARGGLKASFNFMAAVTICSDFRAQENKVFHCFPCFPSICHEVMGLDAITLVFWRLSFEPMFSLSSFTSIMRLFSSSISAIRVVLSAYMRLLIIFLAILIPACHSSSPTLVMMYSAYNLNKQGDNIQPWCTPFPIWNQSVVPCLFLTIASWPAYRFLWRQIKVVLYSYLLKNFPVCCDPHSQRLWHSQ